MNDVFKILINYNNLIPVICDGYNSYLNIFETYNLSLISKSIRNEIEVYCKYKCKNLNLEKHKTYFNNLMFEDCKLPKIILKYVDFNSSRRPEFRGMNLLGSYILRITIQGTYPPLERDFDIYFEKRTTGTYGSSFGTYKIDLNSMAKEFCRKTGLYHHFEFDEDITNYFKSNDNISRERIEDKFGFLPSIEQYETMMKEKESFKDLFETEIINEYNLKYMNAFCDIFEVPQTLEDFKKLIRNGNIYYFYLEDMEFVFK